MTEYAPINVMKYNFFFIVFAEDQQPNSIKENVMESIVQIFVIFFQLFELNASLGKFQSV